MGTKFFSLKKGDKSKPDNSFSTLPSKKPARKQLDSDIFNDPSINQDYLLDQHGSVSVIGFRNTDKELASKTPMTNFLPAVGTYSSKVTPKIDHIPLKSASSQNLLGGYHNSPRNSPTYASKSSINIQAPRDSYYRENPRRSMKGSPYSSPYRNRSIISTGGSSITHYFSYENQNPSIEKNISSSTKPNISFNLSNTEQEGSQIFDSFYNTQAIQDAERALTRNSRYPNGRPTSQRSRNSGNSQFKYRTTINLENLEDIMRLSRESIKNSSKQKALNDENMASSQDNSQLTLISTRGKSNPKTSGKIVDPNAPEVPTTLQELPEEQSDSDSFYDPLPILSRPGSDLDQSNSLTSPSERNEDTSASSSHDLYEGSNNVNLDLRTPKFVNINADNTIDFNIPNSDYSIREGDTTLNSSGVLELGANFSLNDSSILGSSQNNQHYVHNNSPNFSDKNPSQSANFTSPPPMPPPKPKSFLTNPPTHSESNSASRNVSLLNIKTTSETGSPLTAPPRPRAHTGSSENLKDKQDLLPQSPDQVPEKPSFYLASNPSGKFKSNKAHSASYSQDSNTGSFPENDFSLGISNSTIDESGLSLPSFLNDIIDEPSHDEEAINQDLELDNSEIYDPFSLKKQIFEESELPEQVAKAESICNPSSVINHKIESESASINCNESLDLNSPVFEESNLLPKSPKLESITDGPAEAVKGLEIGPADSRDIFSHSRIALDESDLIPESFENSNNAKIDPITNSPLTIDVAKSESSSPNFNSLSKTNALISNFPKPVNEMDKSKELTRASNLSEEVEFRIEKSDEAHLNDSNINKFMNFPLPDPLAKESYQKSPIITFRLESESSLRQSRELANSKLDADNLSQKSKNSGRRYKFPEPIIPPPVDFSPINSGNNLLSPISKTKLHEDDIESGSDTTPQQISFGISSKHDMVQRLHPSRSAGLAFSSGNSSNSLASNIPPKTPKSATFGNHVEYDESILSIDDQDMYEKVRKLEEECLRYRDEIESQAYLLNETTKLMIEERESKVQAEYEMKRTKIQLDEANKSLEQANISLEEASRSLEEQSIRIKSLEEANSSLELANKSLEEQSMRMKSLEEANRSYEEKSKKMATTELELEEAKSELFELKKINEELSLQLETNSELQSALDEAKSTIFQLEQDTKYNESILIEKDDKLNQLEKDHTQLRSNFNSISQDLEDLRRINQQEWLNSSRNSSFINKPRTRTGSSSSSEGKSKYRYSNRRSDTLSSNGDVTRSTIFEESGDEANERSFQITRDSTDTIIAARRVCSLSNNNSEIDINPPNESNNYYEEYQKCNDRVKKLLKQIEGRDKQIAELNELIKSQSNAKSSALNNYNKLASRSMSQLNTSRLSNSSSNSGRSNRSNIFESATLTIQKLQSQLNGIDNGDSLSPRKFNTNTSFNEPSLMSPTLFSPTFKQFTNTEAERSFTNDMLNHLPVSFKLNDIKYREFIEFTGSELKERADTDFVKRVMAEDIECLISCDPNLNNWRTHKQILQALQNSELTLIDSKANNNNDHFTISDLVQQSKTHDRSLSSGKINNTCELCGNHPHHTVTPQFYYKLQLQSDPNPICSACFHRLGTAQKFFKFLTQGINRSNAGFQPHKLYFEVLQLKLDMFLARNGINTPNEIENELIRSHLLWRTNDL
ncbi:hypothetical protein CONCODRAFT_67076 [Conidiobolus coronatus NRRL 28638]|uniref:GDP/GTP exchange factor Sec2 N-terminal domain-containing protein n=1 Tax=Conidiobolus coronatus (strain ATCC 28846 / CBS 209.66 / NRRL 28638) TaxID=796925 RepID=A0A137PJA6_CONC2|nr:hypothetical protein CONCODRAFT_67076 [Conidiobolus coronatus NRRL 28638]|eukprot:KXN75065.1 hypothetical protein CONCODRAFT_67076 [Conidiobolus coronatus NRRL 28638]